MRLFGARNASAVCAGISIETWVDMSGEFFDQATIFLQAGTGGDGMTTMRR